MAFRALSAISVVAPTVKFLVSEPAVVSPINTQLPALFFRYSRYDDALGIFDHETVAESELAMVAIGALGAGGAASVPVIVSVDVATGDRLPAASTARTV